MRREAQEMNRFDVVVTRSLGIAAVALAALALSGCSSLLAEGGSAGAGILGTAVSGAVTKSAAVATGIGIGAQAAARAAIQYEQRKTHDEAQHQMAMVAGRLNVGEVARWSTHLSIALEEEQTGRITVSRVISPEPLLCKEIVFSVDPMKRDSSAVPVVTAMPAAPGAPRPPSSPNARGGPISPAAPVAPDAPRPSTSSRFYVAAICRDGVNWSWASAEPATARWGALQ